MKGPFEFDREAILIPPIQMSAFEHFSFTYQTPIRTLTVSMHLGKQEGTKTAFVQTCLEDDEYMPRVAFVSKTSEELKEGLIDVMEHHFNALVNSLSAHDKMAWIKAWKSTKI